MTVAAFLSYDHFAGNILMERALNQTPQDGSSEEEEPWGLTHIFLHRSCIGGGFLGWDGRIYKDMCKNCTCATSALYLYTSYSRF